MSTIKSVSILLFLLVINVFVNIVRTQENVEEVQQIFDEIEADHNKLKKVFYDKLALKETPECQCVPFYLCNIETGKIIIDGSGLITSRFENICENPQDVCCTPNNVRLSSRSGNLKPKCGYGMKTVNTPSDNDNQPFSEFAEFPWTVVIANYNREKRTANYTCVGSLIHPQVVLTAAHCVEDVQTVVVQAGEWNVANNDEPKASQIQYLDKIIKHHKFQLSNLKYDIALLVARQTFTLDDHINTVCLANSIPVPQTPIADECVATGWGYDKPDSNYSNIMRKMKFSLISHAQCQNNFRATRLGKFFELHKTFVCVNNKYGSDTCQGNGGAPLVTPVANQPFRYQQIGISSWGIGCADSKPSVFTNVPELREWIDEQFDTLGFTTDYYNFEDEKEQIL